MCQIQWIDASGAPTPDDNPAIGRVRCKFYPYAMGRKRPWRGDWSRYFGICADHGKRLGESGMDIWQFEPLPAQQPIERVESAP
jgi:hypothetical protein